ncbi:MAG: hypothetical protein ACRC7N_22310 [Clostridium sp.]
MSATQVMLELAIQEFGTLDTLTIMLSQKRDKEIVKEQYKMLEESGRLKQMVRAFKEEDERI